MLKSTKKIKKGLQNIYMDYAASVEANPSSIHKQGIEARESLEEARKEVSEVLGARSEEIIFTSSGTESNNLAIQGAVFAYSGKKLPHIITTNIEHPSVLETFRLLEKRKLAQISIVPVETSGIVDPKKIRKELKENTILISVMYANNEIGTIQPIQEIAKEVRHFRKRKTKLFSDPRTSSRSKSFVLPFLHTDAVQAVNYLDINVERLGVDMITFSGIKIEEAGRVGVLYKKKSVPLAPILGGGDQEFGLRPGTENLSEIIKFAKAFKKAENIKIKEAERITKIKKYFVQKLQKLNYSAYSINGDLENRLPNNISVTFGKIPSDLLVIELSAHGIMVSSKSACKSSSDEGSYVIKAIKPYLDKEVGAVRFSFGRSTTMTDVDHVMNSLKKILSKLEKWYH